MSNGLFSGESSRHGDEFLMSAIVEMIATVDDGVLIGENSLVGEFSPAVIPPTPEAKAPQPAVEVAVETTPAAPIQPAPVAAQPAQPEATVYDFEQAQRIKAARDAIEALHHSPEIEGLHEAA